MANKGKKRNKRILLTWIVVLLVLCVGAGVYLVKLSAKRAEEARAARAAEEAKIAEEAAEEAGAAEEASAEEAAVKKAAEHIYAYKGKSDDATYSLAAYDSAVDAGANTLAIPFVVSQDGTLYAADDDNAKELTGYAGYFSGMTDRQIDDLETVSGGKVLKLSEVFDKYGKDKNYVIELKYTSERNLTAFRKLIEKYGCEDVVSVSCRYFSGLRSLESTFPDMKKIFLCSDEEGWGEALGRDYIDEISVSREMMDESRCEAAHDRNKKFGAGTLSTEEDIKSAVSMGADSYFTDEAALAVKTAAAMQ